MSKKETNSEQRGTPKAEIVPIAMELIIRRWPKEWRSDDFSTSKCQQRCLGERGWISTQACGVRGFRDGVEALKEFDERDVFVRELQGDVRTVFSSHVDFFVRTRSRAIPPPARRQNKKK